MLPTIIIIGAGRLGKTLGRLIMRHRIGRVIAVYNRTAARAQIAAKFIGCKKTVSDIAALPSADVILVTTSDGAIKEACDQYCRTHEIHKAQVMLHCSGLLTAQAVLATAKKHGASIASIHPARSVANPEVSVKQFAGTFCAYEGDKAALKMAMPIFEKIGANLFRINAKQKGLYHAGLVMASNYNVSLAHLSYECLMTAGMKKKDAKMITFAIMQTALDNLYLLQDFAKALTGPLKRGDKATIDKHIVALKNNPLLLQTYLALGDATLPISGLSQLQKKVFTKLFSRPVS